MSILLFSYLLVAKQNKCWLATFKPTNKLEVTCRNHRPPKQYEIICELPKTGKFFYPDEIDVSKAPEPDLLDRALNFIGVKDLPKPGTTLCAPNEVKRKKRIDQIIKEREEKENKRRQKRDEKKSKREAMESACKKVVGGSTKPICDYLMSLEN